MIVDIRNTLGTSMPTFDPDENPPPVPVWDESNLSYRLVSDTELDRRIKMVEAELEAGDKWL